MSISNLLKPILAAGAVVGAVVATVPAAQAGTDVDIYFDAGFGPGYYDGDYFYEPHHRRHHVYQPEFRRISCWEGKDKVRWAGFHKVRPLDCEGRTYTYKAKRDGDWFLVTVSSRRGRIIDVSDLY